MDARKWIMSKQLPRRYGDRVDVAHQGNIEFRVITHVPQPDDLDE